MKSQKAEAVIKNNEWMDDETQTRAIYSEHAVYAAELAEQEAEERIRGKAIEAFKLACDSYDDGQELCFSGYECRDTCCSKRDLFIQKLNEE